MSGAVGVVEVMRVCDDASLQRIDACTRWSDDVYGDLVYEHQGTPEAVTDWMRYLRGIQQRPGWSVARLARESKGKIHKSTIFRMISGETQRVAVATVRLIADIVGDPYDVAMKAAAGSLADDGDTEPEDPRLKGLDPHDPVVVRILDGSWDEGMKHLMLDNLRRKREQQRELQLQQELEEVERAEEIWKRTREAG